MAICHIAGSRGRTLPGGRYGVSEKERAMGSLMYRVPLFGWILKEAVQGPITAKVLFVANLLMVWLLAILTFGYPAIIVPALAAVPAMFVVLLLITKE